MVVNDDTIFNLFSALHSFHFFSSEKGQKLKLIIFHLLGGVQNLWISPSRQYLVVPQLKQQLFLYSSL